MKYPAVVETATRSGLDICPVVDGSVAVRAPAVEAERKYVVFAVSPDSVATATRVISGGGVECYSVFSSLL